ncbi:MAG: Uma2 family endonuclease [Elainellaceae cyanobacterium]
MDTAIHLPPLLKLKLDLTDEQFSQLCQRHPDLKFEHTAEGDLIIMSPTGGETGDRNSELNFQIRAWNRQTKMGKVFDSSTGFKLPNGAIRSPDTAWVSLEQWNALTLDERETFLPLCPDFVVELMSPSDSVDKVREKMREYQDNGAKLGWLINRKAQHVEIYRPSQPIEVLPSPQTLSGEDILPGLTLDLTGIL